MRFYGTSLKKNTAGSGGFLFCQTRRFSTQSLSLESFPVIFKNLLLVLSLGLASAALAETPEVVPTVLPAAERIIAIGDLHGDLHSARQVFNMAGITDSLDHWIAGDLVVVQTGDQLDRGDQEQELLAFLDQLQDQASAAGGVLHLLNGNHELMNARLDLRYVTEGGFADFADAVEIGPLDSLLLAHEPQQRARVAAFRPGGPFARQLAERNTILVIGDNLFVHGGVLPHHLDIGLEKLNRDIQLWLAGEGPAPADIHNSKSPTWTRIYSDAPDQESCQILQEVLEGLGVARMIVGHTVQEEGIASFCSDKVWCIDAGIAEYYGGAPAVLEIVGDQVRVLGLTRREN
jgi:Calcineurin-like phosphoesterase